MMTRQYCVYCNKEITTRSREHVIQNALGGLYESVDICCPECNNYISKCIDAPFTKIFNPVIGQIDNFSKTNKTKSCPPCTGMVEYNGKTYQANIKANKVVSCPELSRELHCDAAKLPLKIIGYDFNLDNTAFHTGMAKIAFNYALDRGVNLDILAPGLHVQRNGNQITDIKFSYPMIPFCALNPVDEYLELYTPPELYHNMILFSQYNNLWCYIDLFNTFQYYVLWSDKLPDNTKIYDDYAQTLQKLDRSEPKITVYDYKDIMVYAQQYDIEPCTDIDIFTKRVKMAIARKSQKQKTADIINRKIQSMPFEYQIKMIKDLDTATMFRQSMHMYIDQTDQIKQNAFRTVTPYPDAVHIAAYPDAIGDVIKTNMPLLRQYTNAKFQRLNHILCRTTPTIGG